MVRVLSADDRPGGIRHVVVDTTTMGRANIVVAAPAGEDAAVQRMLETVTVREQETRKLLRRSTG